MDINNTFLKGRMNKSFDERILPEGEYIDAMNIRIGSTENNSVGAIENSLGNTQVTQVTYNGSPLSSRARCIGSFEDGEHETIYWFVTDPGVVDMVLSYNDRTQILVYHVVSTSVLNFSLQHLVTGIDLIDGLLFWTDNYNPPRRINVRSNYPYPVSGVDSITEDDISVIVAPPSESPSIQLLNVSGEENYMSDKFISFSYRYKYKDGEYSALSQFSEIAFEPQQFFVDYSSYNNGSMKNLFNSVEVSFNTGGENIVGLDLCFKLSDSSVINIIERYDKSDNGWGNNETKSITFTNKKIYTVLPNSELNRLFDNVPRLAKSQTTMGNRLIYGNYVDGYDIDTTIDYEVFPNTEDIAIQEVQVTQEQGEYNINALSPVTIEGGKIRLDFTGVDISSGSILTIDFSVLHNSFGGSALYDDPVVGAPENQFDYSFSFNIITDFSNAYQLANDPGFIDAIESSEPIIDCNNGFSLTDRFNCGITAKSVIVPPVNDGWDKDGSGVSSTGQGFIITSSTLEPNIIYLQIPAMRFVGVDTDTSTTVYGYEYFNNGSTIASVTRLNSRKSLHSNRDYEVGIVYQDEYSRSSTALVCDTNTVFFPASTSDKKNYITANINSLAPSWARRYKFVVKPSRSKYETIFSSLFFTDTSSFTWFKLEAQNISKVKVGDKLIVKVDTDGQVGSLITTEVLDVQAQPNNFLGGDPDNQNLIVQPAGTYMKLKASNFRAEYVEGSFIEPEVLRPPFDPSYRQRAVNMSFKNPNFDDSLPNSSTNLRWTRYAIPAGSIVNIRLNIRRFGAGERCGSYRYLYEKTIVANSDYDDFFQFIVGQNIDLEAGVTTGGDDLNGIAEENQINSLDLLPNQVTTSDGSSKPEFPYHEPYGVFGENFMTFGYTTEDGVDDGSLYFVLSSGIPGCSGKTAYVTPTITIQQSNGTLVFETEPLEADGEIYYEGSESFPIDGNRFHMSGDAPGDTDQTSTNPAVVTLNFFDCFSFGNGVESYKINDSLTGDPFYLGERVTAVSQEEYKEAHRYATLTYSGIYNAETNINRLNEFNLSLANFKDLERSFGPINKLYARRTDVLVLQEDKISYVLAGKNILSDSAGGGQVASIPEVLGTQIARTEDYGISNNPESFAVLGGEVYFTDIKRNAVLNLSGGSAQSDSLTIISDAGLKYWFRDQFNNTERQFKIGGYDPYMDEYVLSISDYRMPLDVDTYGCNTVISQSNSTGYYQFNVDIGDTIGQSVVGLELTGGSLQITIEYDGEQLDNQSIEFPESYSFTINKTEVNPTYITVTIVSVNASYSFMATCSNSSESITVHRITLNSPGNDGQTIHNQYRWSLGGYTSPYLTDFVSMNIGGVPFNQSQTGVLSSGMIPADGSDITMVSNKYPSDSFIFNNNKFKYLISNTAYSVNELIPLLNEVTPITGSYQATIEAAELSGFSHLYLVWDYRFINEFELCYNFDNPYVVCCDCAIGTYFLDSDSFNTATTIYTDEDMVTVASDGYYSYATTYRQLVGGVLLDAVTCPSCVIQTECFEGVWVNPDPAHPDGGSITYVNGAGETVTVDGIYEGDIATIEFLEILSYTGVLPVECPAPVLSYRSNPGASSFSETLCETEVADFEFYVYGAAGYEISTGDIACNTNSILNRFDGENKYYKIYIASAPEGFEYICQIGTDGYITIIGDPCPPPGI
jgi:hypothetical protein